MKANGVGNVGLVAQRPASGQHGESVPPSTSTTRRATFPATSPRLLAVPAGAKYLGVSVRSLWRLVEAGHLHPVRLPGLRRVAVDVRELDALIEVSRD